MGDVKELCKRVIIIDHGHKVFDGPLQDIIDKYALNKILSLTFTAPVTEADLKKFGTVKEYVSDGSAYTATLLVKRAEATKQASQILQKLPVQDLNIEEPPIEAIIRQVFQAQNKS